MPTSASGSYSLPLLRIQNTPPKGGQTLHTILTDMGAGIREARIQGGGGGGGAGSISTGQIASFTACVRDVITGGALLAGQGISLSVNAVDRTVEVIGTSASISVGQITSFTASVQDVIGIGLAAGTNITLSINATTKVVEIINSAALAGTITTGQILSFTSSVRDVVGGALVAGANVTVSFNAATKLTEISAAGGASGTTIANLASITFTASGSGAAPRTALEKMRDVVFVEDFGGVADAVTDNTAAIYAAMNYFADTNRMPRIHFRSGTYQVNSTINIKRAVHFLGTNAGTAGDYGTIINFAQGVDGFIVNALRTYGPTGTLSGTATASFTGDAGGTIIEGLRITQSGPKENLCVLEFDSTRNLLLGRPGGNNSSVTTSTTMYFMDSRGTLGGTWILGSTKWASNQTLTLLDPPTSFTTSETVVGATATGIIRFISAVYPAVVIEALTGSFTANSVITGAVSGATARAWQTSSADLSIYTMNTIPGGLGYFQTYHPQALYGSAVRFRSRGIIRNCQIIGWANYGVVGNGQDVNLNLTQVENVEVTAVGKDGICFEGQDANACTIIQCSVVGAGNVGIHDRSFLGNHHFSNHVSACSFASYRATGSLNFGVFLGCYSEGGGGNAPFHTYGEFYNEGPLIAGGDHGSPIFGDGALVLPNTDSYSPQPGYIDGRFLRLGKAVRMNGNLSAGGYIDQSPLEVFTLGQQRAGIKLNGLGFRGDPGGYLEFGVDLVNGASAQGVTAGTRPGGKVGCDWETTTDGDGTVMKFFTRQPIGAYALKATNTASYTGSGAVFAPIISGGMCTGVEIMYPGRNYSQPPKIEGRGGLASICATCQVYNGVVISAGLVAGTTFTATTNNPIEVMRMQHGFVGWNIPGSAGGTVELAAFQLVGAGACDLFLNARNGGRVRFGTFTSTAAALTISGYIEIKDASGTLRRLAVVA